MLDTVTDFTAAAVCPPNEGLVSGAFGWKRIRIPAHATGGRVSIFEATVEPGEGPPLHVHQREEETFHILEGRLRIWCGDETFEAAAGASAVLPRGIPHRFCNESDAPVRMIIQCTPGGFEGFFVDIDREGGMDPAVIGAVADRYGLVFLPD